MIVFKFQLYARVESSLLGQVSFCSSNWDILISCLHKIPYFFRNYPSLKTLKVQHCENKENTMKIYNSLMWIPFCKYPRNKSSNVPPKFMNIPAYTHMQ